MGYEDAKKYFELTASGGSPSYTRHLHVGDGSHPFDIPRRVSIHRFLGFDLRNFLHSSVGAFVDLSLYVLLLLIWKPIAILLIYAELLLVGLISICCLVFHELYVVSPAICILAVVLAHHVGVLLFTTVVLVSYKLLLLGPVSSNQFVDAQESLICMGSLSLLARFLPTPP